MPRAALPQVCPRSSISADNQYYIHVAAASRRAICPKRGEILRAKPRTVRRFTYSRSSKACENQYYIHSVSRSVAPIVGANGGVTAIPPRLASGWQPRRVSAFYFSADVRLELVLSAAANQW